MQDFASLFDRHPVPSWVYSVETLRFLAVNDAAVSCYGYSREQFLEMTIEDIRPPQDLERLRVHIAEGACSRPSGSTWRHLRSDGTSFVAQIESTSVKFQGQEARLVAARDVTAQLSNLERLNLALDAGKFAVWEYMIEEDRLIWDPTHSGVYGLDRSLFPTTQSEFLDLVEPRFREALLDAFLQCIDQGILYDCQFQLNLPSLGLRWRHAIGRRILDAAGKPIKIIGIGVDITERKYLEEQVQRSRKLEAVGRLASGIAHDFNNILTVVSGYAHLLRTNTEPRFTAEGAKEICIAADRAARLVRQLLDFSRTVPVDPQPLEINRIVLESADNLRRLLPKNIVVNVEESNELLFVLADRGQLEQLIMNLCLNARDAMHDGGTLTVEVNRDGSHVVLIVADTGMGIGPEIQERMFEPFFTTKEVGSGSGLGLSIVHSIVQQLLGSIVVQSVPNEGSRFSVRLPLSASARPTDDDAVLCVAEDEPKQIGSSDTR